MRRFSEYVLFFALGFALASMIAGPFEDKHPGDPFPAARIHVR